MIRICHMTSVHAPKDIRIFYKECVSLAASGLFEVHLVGANWPSEKLDGVHIHNVNIEKGSRIKRMLTGSKKVYLRALEIDAGIYHFHDPELIRFGKKLQARGKKVIYDVHEDVPRQILTKHWIPKLLRKMIAGRFERYENNAVKKFSAVVAATPHIENRFKGKAKKTTCILNAPMLKEFNLGNQPSYGNRKVVYVGGITRERGIVELIASLKKANAKLLLAGRFFSQEIEQQCKALPGWENVDFFGQVDRQKIVEVLADSSAGIVTLHPKLSYKDSLPIKMFEYMAAGLPVIASDFPLWREIMEKSGAGICVDPENADEITRAITELNADTTKARQMGQNGRNYVLAHFNWEMEEKKLVELYLSLLKKNNV